MKFMLSLVLASSTMFALSACGSGGGSDNGGSAGGGGVIKKKAVDGYGNCTQDLLSDLKVMNDSLNLTLQNMMTDMRDSVNKTIDQPEFDRRTKANGQKMSDAVDKVRASYGDFKCNAYQNGRPTTLNSDDLYKAGDKIKQSLNPSTPPSTAQPAQPVVPTNADGDCPEAFSADYKQLGEDLRSSMAEMLDATRSAMGNPHDTAAIARVKTAIRGGLSLMQGFRSKYPGSYACNVKADDGTKVVVSSADLDENMSKLRTQLGR